MQKKPNVRIDNLLGLYTVNRNGIYLKLLIKTGAIPVNVLKLQL